MRGVLVNPTGWYPGRGDWASLNVAAGSCCRRVSRRVHAVICVLKDPSAWLLPREMESCSGLCVLRKSLTCAGTRGGRSLRQPVSPSWQRKDQVSKCSVVSFYIYN